MKAVLVALAVAVLGFGNPSRANAETPRPPSVDYRVRTLPNGLKVYSVLDRTTPNVALQVWYDVGSKNDPAGRSGFAHLFEHLMFKGTRDMPPEYLSRLTDDVGGESNASTDSDYTEYDEVVPANHLEQLLWAEAERMGSLVIDQPNFVAERSVVEQELRQKVLADPYGRLYELAVPAASFTVHPYQRSPIGSIADLDAATLNDVKAFHALYYRPDGANLIVVGNFDPEQLDAWIDKYFAPINRPSAPFPQVTAIEPPRGQARTVEAYGPNVPLPAVVLTYAAPTADSADAAALEVLDAILTGGEGSRLRATLIRDRQFASDVSSDADLRQQAGLFNVGAVAAEGAKVEQVEGALLAQLANLRDQPVSAAELQTAKQKLVVQALRDRETIDGLATEIGQAVVVEGDAEHVNRDLPALLAVTAADVERVARTYLVDDRRVTIHYRDESTRRRGSPAQPPQISRVQIAALPPLAAIPGIELPAPKPQPELSAPLPVTGPAPVERTLPNGLRVIVVRTGALPLASALLTFKGGAALDPPGKAGLSSVTAALATRGAGERSRAEIASSVEALGDALSAVADDDSSTLGLSGLSTSLAEGLPILADVARHPTFAEAELRRVREEEADGLEESMESSDTLVDLAVAPLVFGAGPYGHTMIGLPRSVAQISRADILREHMRLYRPDNAVLVIAGGVDPEATFALAERAFGDWANPPDSLLPLVENGPSPSGRTIVIDLPGSAQASVTVAGRSIGRTDPSYYAVEVANSVLGGGYSSRLNEEIRIKRGLTYEIGSAVGELHGTGLFSATAQTENAAAPEVAGLMLDQLKLLRTQPPSNDELQAHKAALVGEFRRTAESSSDIAGLLANDSVYGVTLGELVSYPDRIEAVTQDETRAALAWMSDPSKIDVLIVGDAKLFLPTLRDHFGKVEVISIGDLKLGSPSLR